MRMSIRIGNYVDGEYSPATKADVSDPLRGPRNEDGDKKLAVRLLEAVNAMVAATNIDPHRAARWLMHTPAGRELLSTTKNEKEIQMSVDIMKLISVTEEALLAQVTKRDDESYAKAFSRKFENDIAFRKQWRDLAEAKHLQAYVKTLATLTPVSVGVDDINDPTEAVRQLAEMAEKQGRTFEQVFADPANKALAKKTYTSSHLPTGSSTSGSDELQR